MNNSFIWTDLSTYDIEEAKSFYQKCFGWTFQDIGEEYLTCVASGESAAGLYTMPKKFQRIGMPSFWMSYIEVSDIAKTVSDAEKHGAKIELGPQPGPGGGLVALIRDPAGAGFTCYEGEDLAGKDTSASEARMVWNELHISDLSKVKSFYTGVFGWNIKPTNEDKRFDIFNPSGRLIGGIRVFDNSVKGDKEYWAVYFSVASLETATMDIQQAGGRVVHDQSVGKKASALAYDSQGSAFFLMEGGSSLKTNAQSNQFDENPQIDNATPSTPKWRAMLGLFIVLIAILFELNPVWGVLFLIWIIPDLKSGSTHFLEHVERHKNPIVYWLIMATWLALSLYLLLGFKAGT